MIALTVLFGTLLGLWAVLTPPFRAPDEPQHYNSVMRLTTGGGWPAPGEAPITDATLLATYEAGLVRPGTNLNLFGFSVLPRGTLQGWGEVFAEIEPTPLALRSVLDPRAELQDAVDAGIDQMTQHPPLYYALGAVALRAAGALDWRWDHQLLALRLLGCALVVGVVPLVATTALLVSGSRTVGAVAGAVPVGMAQLTHIGASVSNDTLTILLGVATTCLAALVLRGRRGWWVVAALGAVLGLGLLTKGTLLATVPLVALALLVPGRRPVRLGRRVLDTVVALAVAGVVGGWWWARNILVYGAVQPSGQEPLVVSFGDQTPTLVEYVPGAVRRLNESFWGNLGWLELPLPSWVVVTCGVALLALVLVGAFARTTARRGLLVLLVLPAGVLGVVLLGAYRSYMLGGLFGGLQGRYLFPTIGSLLAAAAVGAAVLGLRWLRRGAIHLPTATLVLAVASAATGVVVMFQGAYQLPSETVAEALRRWSGWCPLTAAQLAAVLGAAVAATVAALVVTAHAAARSDVEDLRRLRVSPAPAPTASSTPEASTTETTTPES